MKFYVLWHNRAGLPVWDGPFDTIEQAAGATAMRDRLSGAFVAMSRRPGT